MDTPASRSDIEAAYAKLAAEVGDVYFALEAAQAQVTALQQRMDALRGRREALQKAYATTPAPVDAPSESI